VSPSERLAVSELPKVDGQFSIELIELASALIGMRRDLYRLTAFIRSMYVNLRYICDDLENTSRLATQIYIRHMNTQQTNR